MLFITIHSSHIANEVYILIFTFHGFSVMPDLENQLIVDKECYICFEPARGQSPCDCTTYVHKTCLLKYIEASGASECKVCLAPFEQYPWYIRTYGFVKAVFTLVIVSIGIKLFSNLSDQVFAPLLCVCFVLIIINVYMIRTKPMCLKYRL